MTDGSEANGVSDKAHAEVFSWLRQNALAMGLLAIAGILVVQNLLMQAEIGTIRAAIQMNSKTNATRELLKRAEESIAKGEREIAQIYLLNAAAKLPEDLDVLNRYATFVFEHEPRDLSEVERLRSILQAASYQVAPKDVPAVLELLATTTSTEQAPTQSPSDVPVSDSAPASAKLAELEKVSSDIWKNRGTLDGHIEQLRALVDQVEVENPDDTALLQKLRKEQRRWSAIDQTSRTAEFLDNCLSSLQQLKTNSRLDSEEAVALIQASEQMLVGFWGVDVALLPTSLKETRHAFPKRIRQFVDDIAKAKSQPVLAKIDALCEDAEAMAPVAGQNENIHQDRIKWFEGQLEKSHPLIIEIKSSEELTAAQKRLRRLQDSLSETRREQFNAYQHFAIKRCEDVFKKFNDKWVVSEASAEAFFDAGKLQEIDQSLLSPEVSRILSDLLGKLFAELGPAKLIELEGRMGNPSHKRKLETF